MKTTTILASKKSAFSFSFSSPLLLGKLCRGIIISFLIFLPFQKPIWRWLKLPDHFLWSDEIVIAMAFLLFIIIILYYGKMKTDGFKILLSLFSIGIIGMISGMHNGNSLFVTGNGAFDYVKNFLVIPIFCLFSIEKGQIRSIYRILHTLALFLCFVALVQEAAFFIGVPMQRMGVSFMDVRFGIMRTPSLLGHPNIFGLYSLLFLVLDLSIYRRMRRRSQLLVVGAFLSVSRMIWASLIIALLLLSIQKRSKRTVGVLVVSALVMTFVIPAFYFYTAKEMGSEIHFRGYALSKSIEIWKDHPALGVGPGMYGGIVSFVFDSPVYKQYNFSRHWFNYMSEVRSLDQFWPQLLSEMGIIGMSGFLVLLYVLWKIPRRVSRSEIDMFRKGMLSGLSIVTVVMFLYFFGSGLNLTPFLLTYSVLLGMCLGAKNERPSYQ
jgi:hypothetical protein